MSQIEDFLAHNVDGYLAHDLRKMAEAGMEIGYPLAMTAFAGVELLGGLLSLTPFDKNGGRVYFVSYWTDYLYPGDPKRQAYGPGIYQLMRHGIAHAFVLKGKIGVTTASPGSHLTVDGELFLIDAPQLALDVISSYENRVKPILRAVSGAVTRATMQARLDELERLYAADAASDPFGVGSIKVNAAKSLGASGPRGGPKIEVPSGSKP